MGFFGKPGQSEAERKIRRARSALLRGQPAGRGSFFGQLAMRLDLEENTRIKEPMSTNGRVLRYRPDAIAAMPFEQLVALVGHEVAHCNLQHHTRRGNRDKDLWNQAADFVINLELKDAGFSLPPQALLDDRFAGMAAERVYTLLEQEQPPQQGGGEGEGDGGGQGPKQQRKSQGGKGEQEWAGGVEDMPGDSDEGEDGQGDGNEDGEGDGEQQRQGPTADEIERERREWQMAAVQAAAAAQKMGTLPGFAERYIAELHRPRQNPWERLREFVKETQKSDYRWHPPSRRLISSGYYFPSVFSEDQLGEIVIVIDTSGSIDERTLQTFGKHCLAIQQDYKPQRIHIVWCDAQIHSVDTFEQDEPLLLKPRGGGGTDFRPPFRWVEKEMDEPPICLVYLTDLFGTLPDAPPEYPVMWACISPETAKWGETIHIQVE